MIAYLEGKLTHKTPTFLYIDIGGIAYHVNISLHTYAAIEHLDTSKIYIHQHITESDQSLYGFSTLEEKELFIHLISVSGIGPNTARMVTSYMSPSEARQAIVQENVKVINKVKGIGPKTAKRIILDLKDKLIKLGETPEDILNSVPQVTATSTVRDEAIEALTALGFVKNKIAPKIDKIMTDSEGDITVESLIKQALRQLS